MYFTPWNATDPNPGTKIRVEVGYCDPDGSSYVGLLQSPVRWVPHEASQPFVIDLGSAPRLQFNASSPKRMRLRISYMECFPLNVSYNDIPNKPTRLEIPHIVVPENAFILLFVATALPAAVHRIRLSRKRGDSRRHPHL